MMQMRNLLRYKYFKNTEAIGDVETFIPISDISFSFGLYILKIFYLN